MSAVARTPARPLLEVSIPMMAIDRESEWEEALYEIVSADWPDDDPRWAEIVTAYHLITAIRSRRWSANRGYQAAGEAVLDLIDHLAEALNVDGHACDQAAELEICKEASDAIAKSLGKVIGGIR